MVQRKTNRGQIIDMEALIAAQGDRPAMGNAGTDAHGNVLGPDGKIETPAEERVRAYYQDNPMSSTGQQSLKGNQPQAEFTSEDNLQEVQTAKTQKENVRTAKAKPDTKETQEPEPEAPQEQKPLGYKEVELPNGDIDMVPYYTQEESDAQNKTKK
tara:strand:- start:90 stop:557 length:468 start_codon:yes stop_codon:yes gene_type:complete